ncbi:MAG: helix-turn-helix transcriptional regulator [Muribaculaceae bacterium]|nr:helix-turn-helix transcriptional regulator [Muribaculaceae bacterium]
MAATTPINVNMIKINLRELMWEKNISAVQIQRETGIHATTISRIINGKQCNLGLDTVDKLCSVLDCKIQDLITYERVNK